MINRARQYGKTTTLMELANCLSSEYYVVLIDFQTFGSAEFENEQVFSAAFMTTFIELFEENDFSHNEKLCNVIEEVQNENNNEGKTLRNLFHKLKKIFRASDKPIVLIIDEVDSASNNQVFIDFLAQLRAQYIRRYKQQTFQSVILAGVYDIKNLKKKLGPDEQHQYNKQSMEYCSRV